MCDIRTDPDNLATLSTVTRFKTFLQELPNSCLDYSANLNRIFATLCFSNFSNFYILIQNTFWLHLLFGLDGLMVLTFRNFFIEFLSPLSDTDYILLENGVSNWGDSDISVCERHSVRSANSESYLFVWLFRRVEPLNSDGTETIDTHLWLAFMSIYKGRMFF